MGNYVQDQRSGFFNLSNMKLSKNGTSKKEQAQNLGSVCLGLLGIGLGLLGYQTMKPPGGLLYGGFVTHPACHELAVLVHFMASKIPEKGARAAPLFAPAEPCIKGGMMSKYQKYETYEK
jgi:hypothetical protein